MAVNKKGNILDDQRNSFIDNENAQVSRSVVDEQGNRLLQDIKDNTGGTSNTVPTIVNIATTANIEVSQALPASTKGFRLRARGSSKVLIAFNVGETSTDFVTVYPGETYIDNFFYSSHTIYLLSSKNDTIELTTYV